MINLLRIVCLMREERQQKIENFMKIVLFLKKFNTIIIIQ